MRSLALALILLPALFAANVVGTLAAIRAEQLEVEIKPDSGSPIAALLTPETMLRRVNPGQKDLTQAASLRAAELAIGDRVLATLAPDNKTLLRLVVMDAGAIARQHQSEREEWNQRGSMGIVTSHSGNEIHLKLRSGQKGLVIAGAETRVRRYQPGSVRFDGATPGTLAEIRAGDQLWARGSKEGDTVTAREIVFGSFVTRAGEIVSVDAAARTIELRDSDTGKQFTVRITPDSQLKRMPDFAAMMQGAPRGGMPPFGPGAGPPDPARMIEMMPPSRFEEMKPGETMIVSSAAEAKAADLTAIAVLGNAKFFLRMLAMRGAGTPGGPGGPGGTPGGLGGLGMGMMADLPGMAQ